MKTARSSLIAVIQIAVLFAIVSWPPALMAERWSGTLKRTGKQKVNITLVVKNSDEGPVIKKMIYAGASFEFKQQMYTGETLSFTWMPGDNEVKCSLKRKKEDKYVGDCRSEDSDSTIKMQITAKDNGDETGEEGDHDSQLKTEKDDPEED